MKNSYFFSILMVLSLLAFPACNASRQTKGVIIGAGVGGAAGAVIAKNNRAAGIIIGAALGGIAGGLIGDYMDKQAAKIEADLKGATVERVGEGILITFDSGILFDIDSYALKAETKNNLSKLTSTLNKYDDTDVLVLGHTDDTGAEDYNSTLSKQRASSVYSYLVSHEVQSSRLTTKGYGETDPIAVNTTEEGRQMNRRVEIVIIANKKLQRAAKRGEQLPG
jgi:outer membrane protein OmpA-like peptidoglycan-associated protein